MMLAAECQRNAAGPTDEAPVLPRIKRLHEALCMLIPRETMFDG